jgi:hypothetical protein
MRLPSLRIPARWRRVSRGQAMVEFALILPVLVLLLVLAVDFGRVYFGWVGINNVARIGANEAAWHPDAWKGTGNAGLQDVYRDQVLHDLQSINCAPAAGGPWTAAKVPDPSFVNAVGSADPYELGDHASVTLVCNFTFITPIVGNILGNPLTMQAEAVFPVKGGEILGVPVGGAPPPPAACSDAIVPNMVGMSVAGARSAWTTARFTGGIIPTVADGKETYTVTAQVTTPASSPGDCRPLSTTLVLTTSTPSSCSSGEVNVPNLIGQKVSDARSTWTAAGFAAGSFSPASGSDAEEVTKQTTSPSSAPGDCLPATATVTVEHRVPAPPPPAMCNTPQLIGRTTAQGQSDWTVAKFTGPFNIVPDKKTGTTYTIQAQSLIAGQIYPCSTAVTVYPK